MGKEETKRDYGIKASNKKAAERDEFNLEY